MTRSTLVLTCMLLACASPAPAWAQGAAGAEAAGAEAVRAAAEQVLASRFPESAGRMDVRVRRTGGTLEGGASMRLEFAGRKGAAPEGLVRVQAKARAQGRWKKTGWALLYVAHFDSVVTARSRIRSGETVSPGRVDVAWTETTDLRGEPLRAADFRAQADGGQAVATRILRSGRVLRRRDVRAPYTVDTGTSVEMHYERGRLAFRLSCKAREPGFADDAVRLYCPGTRTTYRARLTEKQTARWIETL